MVGRTASTEKPLDMNECRTHRRCYRHHRPALTVLQIPHTDLSSSRFLPPYPLLHPLCLLLRPTHTATIHHSKRRNAFRHRRFSLNFLHSGGMPRILRALCSTQLPGRSDKDANGASSGSVIRRCTPLRRTALMAPRVQMNILVAAVAHATMGHTRTNAARYPGRLRWPMSILSRKLFQRQRERDVNVKITAKSSLPARRCCAGYAGQWGRYRRLSVFSITLTRPDTFPLDPGSD